MRDLVPVGQIENKIYLIRGQKVMLDRDLAELYGIRTFNLNKAVKRNVSRFPEDFMFQLTSKEYVALRFQIGILGPGRHSKYLPYMFTELGIAMLSSVLKSERAIQVNIIIMRAFVKIRRLLATHIEVSKKLKELEGRLDKHDTEIKKIFEVIQQMIALPKLPEGKIGFLRD